MLYATQGFIKLKWNKKQNNINLLTKEKTLSHATQ